MLLFPHAKINLSLYITGRRPDGYHELDTVFLPLDLTDRLEITPAGELRFSCSVSGLETEDNLVLKAWRLMAERFGIGPAEIRLEKKIPSEAGLGGGSADAAAMLLGINELFGLKRERSELAELGAVLGADVPAQLYDQPVRGRGNGGQIEAWDPVPVYPFMLLKPAAGFSTPAMYRAWDEWAGQQKPDSREEQTEAGQQALRAALRTGDPLLLAPHLRNDFETVLSGREKKTADKAAALLRKNGALETLLCGSGSTVLGLYEDRKQRDKAWERLSSRIPAGWKLFACDSLGKADSLC